MNIIDFVTSLMEHIDELGVSPKVNFDDRDFGTPQLVIDAPLSGTLCHYKHGTGTDWSVNAQLSYYDKSKLDSVSYAESLRKHILGWSFVDSLEKRCTSVSTRYWDKIDAWESLLVFDFRFFDT